MKKINVNVGDVFGTYTVIKQEKDLTIRGGRRFSCKCSICGRVRIFSENYLVKMVAKFNKCICGKEKKYAGMQRDYNFVQKNLGKANLCGYCVDLLKCDKYTRHAINPNYMKKWRIEKITSGRRKKNIILVLECDRFKFDWGKKEE